MLVAAKETEKLVQICKKVDLNLNLLLLKAIFFTFIKQIRFRTAQINNFRTTISLK